MFFRILPLLLLLFISYSCSPKEKKKYQFRTSIKSESVDSNGDGKIDTKGYYMDEEGNYRLVYNEVDRNQDGFSDLLLWMGSSATQKEESQFKEVVKIHEEEDDDYDGKIDTIRWYLPNDLVALTQQDKNKDDYFETTTYYNYNKIPVRTEIDTNSDGRADRIIWDNRAELDTNFDGIPDLYTEAKTKVTLLQNIEKKIELKTLEKSKSWFLNPYLVPAEARSIIGSGYL